MVTHTLNSWSASTHPSVHTHTAVHTHTVNTHPEKCAAIYAVAPGSSWGFSVLLKDTSVMVLKEERALYIHSPLQQFLPDRDSNPQPFNFESDSLTIRPQLPQLPHYAVFLHIVMLFYCFNKCALLIFCSMHPLVASGGKKVYFPIIQILIIF